jgi:SAM-dependent methyltransferase
LAAGGHVGYLEHQPRWFVPMPANLYDYPRYYDLVFGADWKREFQFLRKVFAQAVAGKVRRVFEPACGTGRLLVRMARSGYDARGLDLNPRAVAYCNQRLARYGLPPAAFVGDMADFTLPRPADAAFNMINSFRHLLTEQQAASHLQCMAAAVRPGGVYVLGLHLTPTVGTPLEEETWHGGRGRLQVRTHLKTFRLDLRRRREYCRMTMRIQTPRQQFDIVDELVFRTYTWPQLQRLLASVPAWRLVGSYDFHYAWDRPITIGPQTQDVVLVLQRTSDGGRLPT